MVVFFGHPRGHRSGPQKTKDIQHALNVSLADLYKGIKKKMKVNRNVICGQCKGSGSKREGAVAKCTGCDGSGIRIDIQVHGNMRLQRQTTCPICNGRGESIPESDKCEHCKGDKVVRESKVLEVEVERGMKWGEAISFYGESDQLPDHIAGDLIFVLKPKQDELTEKFERKGHDIHYKQDISFVDALTGTTFAFKHLSGEDIILTYPDPINPGDVLCVPDQGMPVHGQVEKYGDLYVHFNVTFPAKITAEQKKAIISAFKQEKHKLPEGAKKIHLQKLKPKQQQKFSKAYDEDDEEQGGHPQGVQCAQQ